MIHIPPQARVLIIPDIITSEKDIDYYINDCKNFGLNPYSGDIFVFKDEENTQIGMLSYDGHGFHWCIKRYSEGTIPWWPNKKDVVQIQARNLQILLWGGNPVNAELPEMWRPINEI